jgi:hypothetical protein
VGFGSGIWAEIFWEEGYLGWREEYDYEDAVFGG